MANHETWSSLADSIQKTPPPTLEALQRYSAGSIDPWTLALGQALCSRFEFAAVGHRNLADAFLNLPGQRDQREDFEVGYGVQHIMYELSETSKGITFAAVVGVLAEYFHEDLVVDFFLLLTKRANVPDSFRPLEQQWRRLVQVLYGVLALSTFGQCSISTEASSAGTSGDFDLENVLNAMEVMSQVIKTKKAGVTIKCGAEVPFLTAVATWLFGLNYKVTMPGSASQKADDNVGPRSDVHFLVHDSSEAGSGDLADPSKGILPTYRYSIDFHASVGRAPFDRLFRLTFGSDFNIVKDEVLSAYIAGAVRMLQDNLTSQSEPSSFGFLSHKSSTNNGSEFGFLQTLIGWFPELRRLSPRMDRIAKLSPEESKMVFLQAVEQLQSDCTCTNCREGQPLLNSQVCLITMLELIVRLGIYVTRMILHPRLYPKIKGVWKLYDLVSDSRSRRSPDIDAAEDFMQRVGRQLPTSVDMLKVGVLLFTNSRSREIDAQTNLMGITHAGMTVFLNGGFKDIGADGFTGRSDSSITIRVIPGWMCLLGHEAKLEVYDPGFQGWTFEEGWEQVRLQRDIVQLFKWQGELVLTSLMPKNEQQQLRAQSHGWLEMR